MTYFVTIRRDARTVAGKASVGVVSIKAEGTRSAAVAGVTLNVLFAEAVAAAVTGCSSTTGITSRI